jgi:2-polyprenyl-3-methyl-5-hydroxy-6-metoxy-1,4-benzoquinol methylase
MEWRLFPASTVPECATAAWYETRERAPHLEQAAHIGRLDMARDMVLDLCAWPAVRSVVDLGAGDGGLLALLTRADDLGARPRFTGLWGYDLSPANVEAAVTKRNVNVELLDVVTGEPRWADIAVCTEMLEHLVDPHGFLRTIRENCTAVVASSPMNETDRSHYEHHLWAWDVDGYDTLFRDAGFRVQRHRVVDGMFQVLSAVAG